MELLLLGKFMYKEKRLVVEHVFATCCYSGLIPETPTSYNAKSIKISREAHI